MSNRYVFDSYALLVLLEDEKGADFVASVLTKKDVEIYLSIINLGEIYYLLLRRKGIEQAEKVIEIIALDDAIAVVEAPWERVRASASVKAEGGFSYADAFAVALAKEMEVPLLTGDPEIIAKAEDVGIKVLVV